MMYIAAVNIDIRRLFCDLKRDSCAVCRSGAIAAAIWLAEPLLADTIGSQFVCVPVLELSIIPKLPCCPIIPKFQLPLSEQYNYLQR